MKTLRELGPAKLLPAEQERIRSAADALVFSSSVATDQDRTRTCSAAARRSSPASGT
jgi:hypothetical protein